MARIGILALQGAFIEHVKAIERLGHTGLEVRTADQLDLIDGLILPGGESTTMGKLMVDFGLKEKLIERIQQGLPVWGTCAGMILMAKELEGEGNTHLGIMDIKVKRNAYGRHLGSFSVEQVVDGVSVQPIPLVYIRAPYIVEAGGHVQILHRHKDQIVAARQGNKLVTSFHPELTSDLSFHSYFLSMV